MTPDVSRWSDHDIDQWARERVRSEQGCTCVPVVAVVRDGDGLATGCQVRHAKECYVSGVARAVRTRAVAAWN